MKGKDLMEDRDGDPKTEGKARHLAEGHPLEDLLDCPVEADPHPGTVSEEEEVEACQEVEARQEVEDFPCLVLTGIFGTNCKLHFNLIPEWDRHGKTVIAYLCKISELVRLSPQMVTDLGAITPLKFTGQAEMWWTTQSVTVRNYISQSWTLLFEAIETHFLNDQWLQDQRSKFEEMKFRQHRHEEEMPMDFLQRRTRYNAFLYPDQEDGMAVVDRILCTAPTVWLGDINSECYPNLFLLFVATCRHCAMLMASWNTAIQLRTLGNYYTCRLKS
jgi:hypothetical protein